MSSLVSYALQSQRTDFPSMLHARLDARFARVVMIRASSSSRYPISYTLASLLHSLVSPGLVSGPFVVVQCPPLSPPNLQSQPNSPMSYTPALMLNSLVFHVSYSRHCPVFDPLGSAPRSSVFGALVRLRRAIARTPMLISIPVCIIGHELHSPVSSSVCIVLDTLMSLRS